MDLLFQFLSNTGYYLADYRHFLMWGVGILFVYLAIGKEYEPLLLLPIGFGVLVGNVPFFKGFGLGIYEPNSVLHYLYFGSHHGRLSLHRLFGARGDDGLFLFAGQTEADALRRRRPDGHLFYAAERTGLRVLAERSRLDCHHRRSRRSDLHLLDR